MPSRPAYHSNGRAEWWLGENLDLPPAHMLAASGQGGILRMLSDATVSGATVSGATVSGATVSGRGEVRS